MHFDCGHKAWVQCCGGRLRLTLRLSQSEASDGSDGTVFVGFCRID